MYFRNYRLQKKCLDKCLKNLVQENPTTRETVNDPNTVEICPTAPSSYSLITVKAIELEQVNLSDKKNLRKVC